MPLRSMTGFGQMEKQTSLGSCRVEIRAVNGKFLEIQLRVPRSLANLEQRIKKTVSEKVSRGSLSVFITSDQIEEKGRLTWDKAAVESYLRIFREIKEAHGLEGNVSLTHLLQFSDFVKSEIVQLDEASVWKELLPAIEGSLADFQKSRETEAEHTLKDMRKHAAELQRLLKLVVQRAPVRQAAYVQEFRKRVSQLVEGTEGIDEQRIATEIAFMADKLDLAEECSRLQAHIEKFLGSLQGEEPAGKRLNFLAQEMNREATTIAAKANDTDISHLSVEMRENIEKIREQIQNIE